MHNLYIFGCYYNGGVISLCCSSLGISSRLACSFGGGKTFVANKLLLLYKEEATPEICLRPVLDGDDVIAILNITCVDT